MAVFDEFLRANRIYADGFDQGALPMPPRRRVAVVTCMDARLHPNEFLGLGLGDAHVIRNAGGRVTDDAIRSLIISQRLLGTEEIIVIHHTDCGMLTFTNDELVQRVREDLGQDVSGVDFLPFDDLEQSVRDDIIALRNSPVIPASTPIYGATYDVSTGALRPVQIDDTPTAEVPVA